MVWVATVLNEQRLPLLLGVLELALQFDDLDVARPSDEQEAVDDEEDDRRCTHVDAVDAHVAVCERPT